MKKSFRIISLTAFILAVPGLIITDWYFGGMGIFVMFLLATIGLVFDQLIRMQFPDKKVEPLNKYKINRLLNIFALVLFVQSPMGLIYGNRYMNNLGIWLLIGMICCGVIINQLARIKFNYREVR